MSDTPFLPTSRYYGIDTAEVTLPDGTKAVYVRQRLLPSPDRFALLREHIVKKGERIDNVAAAYLNDPEQYWRVCDANGAMKPEDLVQSPGRALRITLPEGIPGPSRA